MENIDEQIGPEPPPPPPESSSSKGGDPNETADTSGTSEQRRENTYESSDTRNARRPEPPERIVQPNIISLDSITSGVMTTVANTVYNLTAPANEVMFSPQLASRLGDAAERELRSVVTLEPGFSERLIATLLKRRVILLTGAAQSGKGTVAKYLASELALRERLTNETFIVEPLESRVRVLPRQLAPDPKFGSRVTIFEDVFEYGNKDLVAFFRSDSAAWEELRISLTANNAFLIFTTSQALMEGIRERVRASCFEISPAPGLAATAVDRKLAWLEAEAAWWKERIDDIRRARELIVLKLQTIPRIASMIDDYVAGDEDLDAVLQRHDSTSPSLLDDLQTDVEAWCFAVTLAITETCEEPLPWSAFERLRRLLTDHIKSDRELFPRRLGIRRGPAARRSERSASGWLSDKPLLARCQATFREDPSGLYEVPAFIDPACGRRIWKALLDHHRRMLLVLTPLFRAIVEEEVPDLPSSVRLLAARALGRIGVIDPGAITLALVASQVDTTAEHPLRWRLGSIVRGAVAGGHERYSQAVLNALAILADVEADSPSMDRVITAISVYSQLGNFAPARPMMQFREIAARHCVPALLCAYDEIMKVEASNRDQEEARTQKAADEARVRGQEHEARARELVNKCRVIASPLQSAIARLCLDDVQALTALRDWISTGNAAMRTFIPFLFLVDGGVADALDFFAVDGEAGDRPVRVNAIIFAAAASRHLQDELAALLCDIYGAIGNNPLVPHAIEAELAERFAVRLVRWAVSAAPAPRFRHGLEELFVTLAAARGGFMRRWLFSLLRRPEFTGTEELKTFASAVRKQMDT